MLLTYFLLLFLIDTSGEVVMENEGTVKITLEDILIFTTGASEISLVGFDERHLWHLDQKVKQAMYLPLHDRYNTFKDKVLFGFSCAIYRFWQCVVFYKFIRIYRSEPTMICFVLNSICGSHQ